MTTTKYIPSLDTALICKAAALHSQCGHYAASRFAAKHNINPRLVRLARQLAAATKAGF